MNRTKKFMRNTVASVFQQAVVIIVGLILPRVMLVCYGSEINGITSSIQQFINYFTLVEAGIGASAIFALYKPLARQDHSRISSIVTAARNFSFLFSVNSEHENPLISGTQCSGSGAWSARISEFFSSFKIQRYPNGGSAKLCHFHCKGNVQRRQHGRDCISCLSTF